MIVFIDANVYVSLLWRPDLIDGYFNAIKSQVASKNIQILLPFTTQSEIKRELQNIVKKDDERIIKSEDFKSQKWFEDEWLEFTAKLEEKLKEDKRKFKNTADKLTKRLMDNIVSNSISPEETIELMNLAYLRKGKGYPPGKPSDRIGDQMAWEIILDQFTDDDVVIVSQDPDWRNSNEENANVKINYLLQKEWDSRSKNKKKIKLYTDIRNFLEKELSISVVSEKGAREKAIKGKQVSVKPPFFPYVFPATSPSFGVASASGYPSNLTASNAGTFIVGAVPTTTTTSTSPGGSISVVEPFTFGSVICKSCSQVFPFTYNFCPHCGTKNE